MGKAPKSSSPLVSPTVSAYSGVGGPTAYFLTLHLIIIFAAAAELRAAFGFTLLIVKETKLVGFLIAYCSRHFIRLVYVVFGDLFKLIIVNETEALYLVVLFWRETDTLRANGIFQLRVFIFHDANQLQVNRPHFDEVVHVHNFLVRIDDVLAEL